MQGVFGLDLTLLNVQRKVVYDERGLPGAILGRGEIDAYGLSLVGDHIKGHLRIACVLIDVGVGGQSRKDGVARIADLHLELVVLRCGRSLSGVDVQPEG